jgi:hypothetical protein
MIVFAHYSIVKIYNFLIVFLGDFGVKPWIL